MNQNIWSLIGFAAVALIVVGGLAFLSQHYTLDNIKSKTVGDGQYGTARWATKREIQKTYRHVPFQPELWRKGEHLPRQQGLVLGSLGRKNHVTALVDCDDIHCLMIGASGVGKTAFFLYPNLEYACASGMSYLALDTKGDLARNYGAVASKYYGYQVSVIDLRNPTRSDGNNLLTLINRYMDLARGHPDNLTYKARAEKYTKILAKSIINPEGESSRGENAYFYESAESLLAAVILLLSEYLPPTEGEPEMRHIVSVFKLVQDLLAVDPRSRDQRNGFQILMDRLPENHRAYMLAGAALTASDQAMASVMSTVLSRLNSFLDTELEQVLCFDSAIDAETFASQKCAMFLILPEEDATKNFMAGLIIQNLARELFFLADENDGKLKNRVVFFCDELGTMPPFDILPLFSAGRSRRLTLVPIIQSIAQLEKNYGKEGAEILTDNCQDTIFKVLPKSRTKSFDPLRQHSGGVLTCGDVLVKFVWGQLRQVPLAAVLVVIIHPAVNGCLRIRKGCPTGDLTGQLVFHVPEKALLGCVVPAVAPAGHGAPQLPALHQLNEFQAGVVGALVTVDHSLFVQRGAVVLHQPLHHLQNEIHFQRFAHGIG